MRRDRTRRAAACVATAGVAIAGVAAIAQPGLAHADPAPGVELGAAVRLRYETADAAFLGPPIAESSDVLLTRALVDFTARSAQGTGVHVQFGWHDEAGRRPRPSPTDVDGLDVQQAYVDLRLGATAQLRAGRQEIVLGSARLVGVRESPNIRRSFDGAQLTWHTGAWTVRALELAAVTVAPGAFDDSTDRGIRLDGLYATRDAGDAAPAIDVYALRYRNERARYAPGSGAERRWSFGTRVFATRAALDCNFEAIVQTGSFGTRSIRAWTIASDTGWTFRDLRFAPRLGLKANVTSGDRDPSDGRLGTFNALFPNLSYFSEAATIAPQNHADVQVSATLQPAAGWTVRIGVDRFWRTTANDAVYRANGAPYAVAGSDRDVARQATLDVVWRTGTALELKAGVVRWQPAGALVEAGAHRTWFGMLSVLARA